jgi:hypothetical protein
MREHWEYRLDRTHYHKQAAARQSAMAVRHPAEADDARPVARKPGSSICFYSRLRNTHCWSVPKTVRKRQIQALRRNPPTTGSIKLPSDCCSKLSEEKQTAGIETRGS